MSSRIYGFATLFGSLLFLIGCQSSSRTSWNGKPVSPRDALKFYKFEAGFEYPSAELQEANLTGYFQDINQKLARQSVDATLREMSYIGSGGAIENFLSVSETDDDLERTVRRSAGMLLQRWQKLKSLDSDSMPRFVVDALERGNLDALCVALPATWPGGSNSFVIEGLRRFKHPHAVPSLAYYLSSVAVGPATNLPGADDINNAQKRALYGALFQLTGVAPADFHDTSEAAVSAYLNDIDQWVSTHIVTYELRQIRRPGQ